MGLWSPMYKWELGPSDRSSKLSKEPSVCHSNLCWVSNEWMNATQPIQGTDKESLSSLWFKGISICGRAEDLADWEGELIKPSHWHEELAWWEGGHISDFWVGHSVVCPPWSPEGVALPTVLPTPPGYARRLWDLTALSSDASCEPIVPTSVSGQELGPGIKALSGFCLGAPRGEGKMWQARVSHLNDMDCAP